MKTKVGAYKAFNYAFAALCVCLVAVNLLFHDNPFLILSRRSLVVAAGAGLAAMGLLAFLWKCVLFPRLRFLARPLWEGITVGAVLLFYLILQILLGLKLQVLPQETWDFPMVAYQAQQRVQYGVAPDSYFALFSNNAPLYWLLTGLYAAVSVFGVQDFMSATVVFNCICINLSLLLLYGIARRLWGPGKAIPALLLGVLSPALLLYGPIAYTDTITMPLVCGAGLLWLIARDRWRSSNHHGAAAAGCAAFLLAAAGAVLKVSVAILAVAFVLDIVLYWSGKQRFSLLAAVLLGFAVLLWGGNAACRAALPEYEEEGIPFTHWIMMGLRGNGGYWDPDYDSTLAYDTYEERLDFTKQEIVRRIRAMRPQEMLEHCIEKLSYIISDGTYYAPSKLDRGPKTPSVLHEFVISGGKYAGILYYYADALQIILLLMCGWSAWRDARTDKKELVVLRVALFGLLLFLMIWEARSRYMLNFLPLLLCGCDGLLKQKTK